MSLIFACSEGDTIQTNVDFEGVVESCGNTNTRDFVFYKIDNANNQVLSFNFRSTTFSLEKTFEDTVVVALNNSTNRLLYRVFDSEVEGDSYFCNSIPPSDITITQQFVSENGTANIIYGPIEGSDVEFTRTLVLENVTFVGEGITLRKELFDFGTETFEPTE